MIASIPDLEITMPATSATILLCVSLTFQAYVLPPRARTTRKWMDQMYEGEIEVPCVEADEAPVAVIIHGKRETYEQYDRRTLPHAYAYRVHEGLWYVQDPRRPTVEGFLAELSDGKGLRQLPGYTDRSENVEHRRPMIAESLNRWASSHLIIDGDIWMRCAEPYWYIDSDSGWSYSFLRVACCHHFVEVSTRRRHEKSIECYRLDELDLARNHAEDVQRKQPIRRRDAAGELVPVKIDVDGPVDLLRPDLLNRPRWRQHAAHQRMIAVLVTVRDARSAIAKCEADLDYLLETLSPEESTMGIGGDHMRSLLLSLQDLQKRLELRPDTQASSDES